MKRQIRKRESSRVGGTLTISKYRDGRLVSTSRPMPNKVVAGAGGYGRNIIARHIVGDTTYPLEIDSAAVGDDDTAPTDGDTALGNQLVGSISITNTVLTNNIIQIDVFVADANLPDDTYEEFGLFCDGRLFARIIIDPSYTKASGEDTLFTYTLTLAG